MSDTAADPYESARREAVHILALVDDRSWHEEVEPHLVLDVDELRGLLDAAGVGGNTARAVLDAAERRYSASALDRRLPRARCPDCRGRVVPVVVGLPEPALMDLSDYGLVSLSGCLVGTDDPTWQCTRCGASGGDAPADGRSRS